MITAAILFVGGLFMLFVYWPLGALLLFLALVSLVFGTAKSMENWNDRKHQNESLELQRRQVELQEREIELRRKLAEGTDNEVDDQIARRKDMDS